MQSFDRLMGRGVIDEQLYEELEEALLQADTHVEQLYEYLEEAHLQADTHEETAVSILDELRRAVRDEKITDPQGMKERLKQAIAHRMEQDADPALRWSFMSKPTVYLFVGVNGVGKTTTIAKLAQRLRREGKSVMLAAGDTFRAAAIEQLEVWAERTGSEIVRNQAGSDSAAVIFDAIQAARARGVDVVLADTAGRQHSKESLMTELSKVTKVIEKGLGRPADEVLLVLDANTGQNAIRQAEEFIRAANVSGLVLTKLDGTARGGALLGVFDRFKVPIKLIGVGEKAEDLRDFRGEEFATQMFE